MHVHVQANAHASSPQDESAVVDLPMARNFLCKGDPPVLARNRSARLSDRFDGTIVGQQLEEVTE
jgi:hypothetical protein